MTLSIVNSKGHRFTLNVDQNEGDLTEVITEWLKENFDPKDARAALEAIEPLVGRACPNGKALLSQKNGWQAILAFKKRDTDEQL